MKTLILVRHGKSSRDDPALTDHERPLNPRGQRDGPRMGRHLARHYPLPQRIVSSTALRARQTAEALADALGYPQGQLQLEAQLYGADTTLLLQLIHGLDDGCARVMLVGHNPGITELLEQLTGAGIDNIPTLGVASIVFDAPHWSEIAAGRGRLLAFDAPRSLYKQ